MTTDRDHEPLDLIVDQLFLCLSAVVSIVELTGLRNTHQERWMGEALVLHELVDLLGVKIKELEEFDR